MNNKDNEVFDGVVSDADIIKTLYDHSRKILKMFGISVPEISQERMEKIVNDYKQSNNNDVKK